MELQHFSHHHPLYASCVKKGKERLICCRICNLDVSGEAYGCYDCQFVIHISCGGLPREIDHPFHPIHPLTLTTIERGHSVEPGGSLNCDACGWKSFTYVYHCSDCSFHLDLFCASLIPKPKDDDEEIRSQIHQHPLTLCNNMSNTPRACFVCELPLDRSILVCLLCRVFLHKSCSELPATMKHSFHLYHQLTLAPCDFSDNDWLPFKCKVCKYSCRGFAYSCLKCKFHIHITCALQEPSLITTELHKHPLAFVDTPALYYSYRGRDEFFDRPFETKPLEFKCSVCKSLLGDPFFRCVDCDFNLHVNCIPVLPSEVDHQGHLHKLFLTKEIITDFPFENPLDLSIEYYCASCEQQRFLFDRSYFCKECHYVAHVQCVAPELVSSMRLKEDQSVSNSMQLKEDELFSNRIWKSIDTGTRASLFLLLLLVPFIIGLAARRALGFLPQLISQTTSIVAVTFICSGFSGCFPSIRHHFRSRLIFVLLFLLCKPLLNVVL